MWTWILLLLPVAAIAAVVWNFRRQTAARDAASAERMNAFLGKSNTDSTTNSTSGQGLTARVPAPAPVLVTPVIQASRIQPQAVAGFAARQHLLSAKQLVVYRLLKSALPEHEVLPRMSLSAFLQPPDSFTGFAREAEMRRLADAVVDFLVCDKSLKLIAAVQYGVSTGKAAETAAFVAACVASTGIRWVEMAPAALPKPEAIKQLVLGA